MTIGIPKALGYYRLGRLWENFFSGLNVPYILSEDTNAQILSSGLGVSTDEICLPAKLYLGHVKSLFDRCDFVLVPNLVRLGRSDEFCIRFWGMYDVVRATFPGIRLLSYSQKHACSEPLGFIKMGRKLGKSRVDSSRAYFRAHKIFREEESRRIAAGQRNLATAKTKILIAANSYIAHEPFLGGVVAELVRAGGAEPLFCDYWESAACRAQSSQIADGLYWLAAREILGALQQARQQVDGVVLLTAFPCGVDCLTNELVMRRVKDVPIINILLDEQQGQAGLATRIESFMDMLEQRKVAA